MKLSFLQQFDTLICHYLGLDHEVVRVNRVHCEGKTLKVARTSGFKRHNMKSSWDEFTCLEAANLQDFGQQMGGALGTGLVISFKEPKIRIHEHA